VAAEGADHAHELLNAVENGVQLYHHDHVEHPSLHIDQ
jgi:hypothetical protein